MLQFEELDPLWKFFVILGIISSIIVIGLTIFIILIFKTDLITWEMLLESKTDINEYNDFINDWKDNNSLEEELINNKLFENLEKEVKLKSKKRNKKKL